MFDHAALALSVTRPRAGSGAGVRGLQVRCLETSGALHEYRRSFHTRALRQQWVIMVNPWVAGRDRWARAVMLKPTLPIVSPRPRHTAARTAAGDRKQPSVIAGAAARPSAACCNTLRASAAPACARVMAGGVRAGCAFIKKRNKGTCHTTTEGAWTKEGGTPPTLRTKKGHVRP